MTAPNEADRGGQLIVLEVPHRGAPRAWACFGADAFVAAVQAEAPVVLHFRIDSRQVVDMFEPDDDLPEGLDDIFRQHAYAVGCFEPMVDGSVYYAPTVAPSEFEVAYDYLAHDLQALQVLTVEEAREWVGGCPCVEDALLAAGVPVEAPAYEAELIRQAAAKARQTNKITRELDAARAQTTESLAALAVAIERSAHNESHS